MSDDPATSRHRSSSSAAVSGPTLPALLEVCSAAATGRSVSRQRQLAWVCRELTAYIRQQPAQGRPRSAADLLTPQLLSGYLARADAGLLRSRIPAGTSDKPKPSTAASGRVRRRCLQLLAAAAGRPSPELDAPAPPAPRPRCPTVPGRIALSYLVGTAMPRTASSSQVREAAISALLWENGLRTSELTDLTVDDPNLEDRTLSYTARPQAGRGQPETRITVRLSTGAVTALRHWLDVRAELTPPGRTDALFVSLAANHDGRQHPDEEHPPTRRPPGIPLQPNGLRRAHQRTVRHCNRELLGTPGYSPLPYPPTLFTGADRRTPPPGGLRRPEMTP